MSFYRCSYSVVVVSGFVGDGKARFAVAIDSVRYMYLKYESPLFMRIGYKSK